MSPRARLFRGPLLIAVFLVGAAAQAALAQELQLGPQALEGAGAVSAQPKGKKAKAQQAPRAGAAAGQQQGGPNRQFGELEGWSPGKAPPLKPGEKETTPSGPGKSSMPIGMSPSGNMSVGLPF